MTPNEAREKFYQMDEIKGGDKRTIRGKYVTTDENGESPELSETELEDFTVALRKRLKKKIKESR